MTRSPRGLERPRAAVPSDRSTAACSECSRRHGEALRTMLLDGGKVFATVAGAPASHGAYCAKERKQSDFAHLQSCS